MKNWIALITRQTAENANTRMKIWRGLKSAGAEVLRDGVYLMPESELNRNILESLAKQVSVSGGTAYVVRMDEPEDSNFQRLFDRTFAYSELIQDIRLTRAELTDEGAEGFSRRVRKLRKRFMALVKTDFFPTGAQSQTRSELQALERAYLKFASPEEPNEIDREIPSLDFLDYAERIWATRRRPWVDRLASAWLIRGFIDIEAKFLWLDSVEDCPPEAVGFDFDGAQFTHIASKVTYEVLLASFNISNPALQEIGHLVHYLDVGGVPPKEAIGIERVLAGMRELIVDDDQLLRAASSVFDGLLYSYKYLKDANDDLNN